MAKVNNKTKGFGSIPRDVVYDNQLSDRARFVYVYMACKPEGWEYYQDKVAEELGYGKDTLRKYLDELIIRGWITEKEQQNDGKFGCLEYDIEVVRKAGNVPIRKKADTEKSRNGKIPNQRNIDSISSKHSLSDNKEIEKEKRLSNDNQKMQDELFEKFWESYGYKKGKQPCQKAWKRLTKQDKESAIAAIGKYKEDCRENQRQMKHPTTYLNQRTWEDDFTNNGMQEDDRWQQQREWLQEHCPNIADKITSRILMMFREMCLCDSQMTAEALGQLNEVYEGGDIVEEFKRLRS